LVHVNDRVCPYPLPVTDPPVQATVTEGPLFDGVKTALAAVRVKSPERVRLWSAFVSGDVSLTVNEKVIGPLLPNGAVTLTSVGNAGSGVTDASSAVMVTVAPVADPDMKLEFELVNTAVTG